MCGGRGGSEAFFMVIICSKTMRSQRKRRRKEEVGGASGRGRSGLSILNSHYPSLVEKVNERHGGGERSRSLADGRRVRVHHQQ